MTATLLGISPEDREATQTASAKEYRYVAKVSTSDVKDGAQVVLGVGGLPKIGDLYQVGNDFDADAIVTSLVPRQTSTKYWEVEITASTDVDEDPAEQIDNPLLQPAKLSYGFVTRVKPATGVYASPNLPPAAKLYDGGILAPNGEPFVPQPEAEVDDPQVTVTKNVATLPLGYYELTGSVNSTPYLGAEARQLRLKSTAQSSFHKTVGNYWQVTFVFTFRFETWDIMVQNQGTYYWENGLPADPSAVPEERKDRRIKGRPVIVNLTTDGKENTTNTPTYTRIRYYRELDYNTLGIL